MKHVVIDAGHGGKDSGVVGYGMKEKDLALTLSLKMGWYLTNLFSDVKVSYTRTTDVFLELSQRCQIANNLGADLFISNHVNGGGGTGYEDFVHSNVSDSGETGKLRGWFHEKVAPVVSQFSMRNRGKKKADYAVLRGTNMPAILTEIGFLDTAFDANLLKDTSASGYLEHMAKAYAEGVGWALGLPRKGGQPPQPEVKKMYRINIGDFDSIEWTASALKEIKAVYPSYGVWTSCIDGGYHRIKVGDFNDKTWADNELAKLKENGINYGSWIEEI